MASASMKCTDDEFVQLFTQHGATEAARIIGCTERNVYLRRASLSRLFDLQLSAPTKKHASSENPARINLTIENGVVLVGGDGHYWPGKPSTAHRAFVKFARDLKPKALIYNGDAFDGAAISRHPTIGWESQPSVVEELEAVQLRLGELEQATPRGCRNIWTLGNHDLRFETRLATVAPEFRKVRGFHLKDNFPTWEPAWACWINDDVVIKHRLKGGTHATHNNVVAAGKTMVTNHLHSLKVTPFSDYSPRPRWGVDCGTLADPNGPQFIHYSEDAPKNHRSGFAVLTFKKGRLLWPEVVHVFDESHVEWRGEVIRV